MLGRNEARQVALSLRTLQSSLHRTLVVLLRSQRCLLVQKTLLYSASLIELQEGVDLAQ